MRALDGPAQGVALKLRRCPIFLRLTSFFGGAGSWDAMTELGDELRAGYVICVYRMVTSTWRDGVTVPGGRYEVADYVHVPDAPTAFLEGQEAWTTWCVQQARDLKIVAYDPLLLPDGLGRRRDQALPIDPIV